MKQCPTCGADVQPEWSLCPSCMSKLPSLITSPTVVQQPAGPVTFDAAAEVPETPPSGSQVSAPPGAPAPSPAPIEAPPAGKPPEKRDLVKTLTHPVLLGLVGALVIFLVLGLMLPGGLSDLFGGKSVDARQVIPITSGTTPSLAAFNTVVPLTPVNTTVNVTAVPPPTTAPPVKPLQTVTANQAYNPGKTLSPYIQNGGGGDGTWRYEPTSVATLTNIETAAPIVTWTTPVTFPIMPTPTLQMTVATQPQVYPVIVTAVPVQSLPVGTNQVIQGGHPTGPLAWAGSGNYASDLFDLSSGVAKLSVTSDQAAVVKVMDSTGQTIGSTAAGPQIGSNAIPVPATGRYLVDVTCFGTWTVTVSVLSA